MKLALEQQVFSRELHESVVVGGARKAVDGQAVVAAMPLRLIAERLAAAEVATATALRCTQRSAKPSMIHCVHGRRVQIFSHRNVGLTVLCICREFVMSLLRTSFARTV